jgi:hypothetical protein
MRQRSERSARQPGVQVKAQVKTLDFQEVISRRAVKIVTFAGLWQDFDAGRDAPNLLIG